MIYQRIFLVFHLITNKRVWRSFQRYQVIFSFHLIHLVHSLDLILQLLRLVKKSLPNDGQNVGTAVEISYT